ncbi:2OG-Fe(II) oxygenase family protein [Massilia sp. DJPM01]|uniref:2OG-Fe(II) oxygenase family protein n=1 Tax=Massilia sp. DJPM01 TaxID=3024404 RepID=UPI00259D9CC2|nr:2OG-Fe(II) oxygenase family protein [Massilia sp. DJPM01]MDM5179170.1 2OG-Fe(II) oxygenase family protein [Massilia sp. DJPM01]
MAHVPVIDIGPLLGGDAQARRRAAAQIDSASRADGFFYASGHGIDVTRLQQQVNRFHHAMTEQEKLRIAIHAYNPANPHVRNGYYMAIKGKKAVESFCYLNPAFTDEHPMIRKGAPMHEVNWWPDDAAHPGFRAYCEQFYADMLALSRALLRGYALALGKEEGYFDVHVTPADTLSAASLIRYPYLDDYPATIIGADGTRLSFESHVDVSLLTVLFQTPIANLQVETADGWLDVPVSGEHFLVNCGTFMEHLTMGYYRAPLHRVKWVNAERLSLPFFVHAGNDATLQPFNPHAKARAGPNPDVAYGAYLQHGLAELIRRNGQT